MGAQVSKILISERDLFVVREKGLDVNLYKKMRNLGLPHSFFLEYEDSIESFQFLEDTKSFNQTERAHISTAFTELSKRLVPNTLNSEIGIESDELLSLLILCCKCGIKAENLLAYFKRILSYLFRTEQLKFIATDFEVFYEYVAGTSSLTGKLNIPIDKALLVMKDWFAEHRKDAPDMGRTVQLIFDLETNFGLNPEKCLSIGQWLPNDFSYVLWSEIPIKLWGKVQNFEKIEDELLAFSPIELFHIYIDVVAKYLMQESFDIESNLYAILDEILKLEGFEFIKSEI